jgi:hypothetical protein
MPVENYRNIGSIHIFYYIGVYRTCIWFCPGIASVKALVTAVVCVFVLARHRQSMFDVTMVMDSE